MCECNGLLRRAVVPLGGVGLVYLEMPWLVEAMDFALKRWYLRLTISDIMPTTLLREDAPICVELLPRDAAAVSTPTGSSRCSLRRQAHVL